MGVERARIPVFYQHITCGRCEVLARCGGRRRCQSAIGCKIRCKTIAKDVTGSGKSTKDVIALIQAC